MMSKEPRDGSLLIGLHKLAEQNGEGLVPELYALLSGQSGRGEEPLAADNVLTFPKAISATAAARRHLSADAPTGQATASVLPLRRP
jgi:hypothetical protein